MEFSIEPNGCVKNIRIIDSEPSDVFDDAARQSLATWRFDTNGSEKGRVATQTIDFTLGEGACTPQNKSLNADAGKAGAG